MTARGIGIFTIEFPDPTKINYENTQFNTLNESTSFQYRGVTNIQTLSTKGVSAGSDPYGILYVPDLSSDSCKSNETHYVPGNATRITNLPADRNYALIAVAPWFSEQCTLEYFSAARQQAATKGFLTYLPGTSNAQPPVLNDPAWNLQDGGMWQKDNTFPVYALSSMTGSNVMEQLNLYSGNLSTVPHGDDLGKIFDSTVYVRLWATVSTASSGTLPSLWVFLVIVLAILIAAIGTTSMCMHVIQRRRRNALRQRVQNGEIDLEALGVKRLTVSQQVLDKMPIVTYTAGPSDAEKSIVSTVPAGTETGASAAPTASTTSTTTFSQPTCPICIDDFEPNETQVRELPCRHIFHPDCIDTFLLRNSSLCPMCKQSVLPAGACPVKITNMMVRRERHITRMRARSEWSAAHGGTAAPVSVTVSDHARGAFGSIGRAVRWRRMFSTGERTTTNQAGDIEMGTAPPSQPAAAPSPQPISSVPTAPPPLTAETNPQDCEPPPTPTQNRREWARQRALQLLGNRPAPTEIDALEREENARPGWKRALNKVFPGFR
ncbi:hypothetical protein E8E13_008974 [Curvularia kusanoi]|uniref:RING-type domain-containing protein n=1 Tax=Curvularia kusanoi TaxID=90978 RepID=A0A9P4TF90_CURKU|nr:hypothetical protein E8E13_008974 [Curvularia kusanoi]